MRQALATLPSLARVSNVGQHIMTNAQQTAFKCRAFLCGNFGNCSTCYGPSTRD